MTPLATIVNLSATGDVIIGPGGINCLAKFLPVSCMGDAVSGPVCVAGVITMTTAINNLVNFRPVANMGSLITGVSFMGFPVATAVAVCPNFNIIV